MASLPPSNAHSTRVPIPPSHRKLYRVRERRDRNGNAYLSEPHPTCLYCGKRFISEKACNQHKAMKPECRQAEQRALQRYYQERQAGSVGGTYLTFDWID